MKIQAWIYLILELETLKKAIPTEAVILWGQKWMESHPQIPGWIRADKPRDINGASYEGNECRKLSIIDSEPYFKKKET